MANPFKHGTQLSPYGVPSRSCAVDCLNSLRPARVRPRPPIKSTFDTTRQVNEKMRIQYGLTPEDLDTLEVSDLETLTLGELNALAYDDAGAEPATYTINSILDPDTRRRWLNILVTMVRA